LHVMCQHTYTSPLQRPAVCTQTPGNLATSTSRKPHCHFHSIARPDTIHSCLPC
jgi:hypothetical protein